jgi:hypothetical protein
MNIVGNKAHFYPLGKVMGKIEQSRIKGDEVYFWRGRGAGGGRGEIHC